MIKNLLSKLRAQPLTQQGYIIASVFFILDQLSKWAVLATIPSFSHKVQITPFMDFIHLRNSGVSYGMFSGYGAWGRWLLTLVALALIIICARWLSKAQSLRHAYALGLIIGGGSGNLLDRLLHGAVIDFISLHAFGFYWYVFNIADICLTFGIILFFIAEFTKNSQED